MSDAVVFLQLAFCSWFCLWAQSCGFASCTCHCHFLLCQFSRTGYQANRPGRAICQQEAQNEIIVGYSAAAAPCLSIEISECSSAAAAATANLPALAASSSFQGSSVLDKYRKRGLVELTPLVAEAVPSNKRMALTKNQASSLAARAGSSGMGTKRGHPKSSSDLVDNCTRPHAKAKMQGKPRKKNLRACVSDPDSRVFSIDALRESRSNPYPHPDATSSASSHAALGGAETARPPG